MAAVDHNGLVAESKRGLTGLNHEDLRVRMAMQLRSNAWLRVHEERMNRLDPFRLLYSEGQNDSDRDALDAMLASVQIG